MQSLACFSDQFTRSLEEVRGQTALAMFVHFFLARRTIPWFDRVSLLCRADFSSHSCGILPKELRKTEDNQEDQAPATAFIAFSEGEHMFCDCFEFAV
jgi:hypothetical protein